MKVAFTHRSDITMRYVVVCITAALALSVFAQEGTPGSTLTYEYGSWRDLKNVTFIYVDTGVDLELRDEIVDGVQKQLGNLVKVAERAADAEVVLKYEGGVRSMGDGMWKKRWASGVVFTPVDDQTIRLILTFKRPEEVYRVGFSFTGDFISAFVKAYRDANNLDKNNKHKP